MPQGLHVVVVVNSNNKIPHTVIVILPCPDVLCPKNNMSVIFASMTVTVLLLVYIFNIIYIKYQKEAPPLPPTS